MQLNSDLITSAPVAAATVVMLRDGATGLEVFMQRRSSALATFGGAYVFPGGKVDADDAAPDWPARLDQPLEALQSRLAQADLTPAQAGALHVAAVREALEECGVLFAHGAPAQLGLGQPRTEGFAAWLDRQSLVLDTHSLIPWSRWITPRLGTLTRKRFDTRFFIAAAPPDQVARHDDIEATHSLWISARAALLAQHQRRIELAPPQVMSLVHLSRYASVAEALHAAGARAPVLIEPAVFDQAGVRLLCYPGDPLHPVPERALPGPTRLRFIDQGFEAEGGFDALFA